MRWLSDLVAVIGFSIGGLLFFYLPEVTENGDFNSILSYSLIAITFFYIVWTYKLPSLAFFRLPEFSFPSIAGLGVVFFYSWLGITSEYATTLPIWPTITGIIYLFSIGIGEELISRGFVFGVLKKYGTFFAVMASSLLFGLMHLNLYIGDDWDYVHAYWHCLSSFGFGLVCATVMVVCRSIIAPIVMHALYDWTVVFEKPATPEESGTPDADDWAFGSLWDMITESLAYISLEIFLALLLLVILKLSRIRKLPRFLKPILLKFGLVEEVKSTAS